MRLLLDTTVLSRLCYPFREENRSLMEWFEEAASADDLLCAPEITDYETRRGLLHLALRSGRSTTRSLHHLDQLGSLLTYLPLTTPVMRRAARLWADGRFRGLRRGRPWMRTPSWQLTLWRSGRPGFTVLSTCRIPIELGTCLRSQALAQSRAKSSAAVQAGSRCTRTRPLGNSLRR